MTAIHCSMQMFTGADPGIVMGGGTNIQRVLTPYILHIFCKKLIKLKKFLFVMGESGALGELTPLDPPRGQSFRINNGKQ